MPTNELRGKCVTMSEWDASRKGLADSPALASVGRLTPQSCHKNCHTSHRFWLLPVLSPQVETLGFTPRPGQGTVADDAPR